MDVTQIKTESTYKNSKIGRKILNKVVSMYYRSYQKKFDTFQYVYVKIQTWIGTMNFQENVLLSETLHGVVTWHV